MALPQTTPERERQKTAMLLRLKKDPKLRRRMDDAMRTFRGRVLTEAILMNGPDAKPEDISAAAANFLDTVAGTGFPKGVMPFTRTTPTSQASAWEIRELRVAMAETDNVLEQALRKPFTVSPGCVEEALVRMRMHEIIPCRRIGGGKRRRQEQEHE